MNASCLIYFYRYVNVPIADASCLDLYPCRPSPYISGNMDNLSPSGFARFEWVVFQVLYILVRAQSILMGGHSHTCR